MTINFPSNGLKRLVNGPLRWLPRVITNTLPIERELEKETFS